MKFCLLLINIFIFLNSLHPQDTVLDYSINLLSKNKVEIEFDNRGEPKYISNAIIDDNIYEITKGYFNLGYQDKAIKLSKKILLEDNKLKLISSILNSSQKIKSSLLETIIEEVQKSKNFKFKKNLYFEILIHFLKSNEKKKAIEIWHCLDKLIEEKSTSSEYGYNLIENLSLTYYFEQVGLNELSEKITNNVHHFVLQQNDLDLYIFLLQKYYQLRHNKGINNLIKKIEKKLIESKDTEVLFDFSLLLLKLEYYELAEKILERAFESFESIKDRNVRRYQIAGLFNTYCILKNKLLMNILVKNAKIKKILEEAFTFKPDRAHYSSENYTEDYEWAVTSNQIEFLVNSGYYYEAKELVNHLDRSNITKKYSDFYYYCLGLIYNDSLDIDSLVLLIDYINNRSLAVDLLLRAAKYYRLNDNRYNYLETMKKINIQLKKPDNDLYLFGKVDDVLEEWINGGFIKEALFLYNAMEEGQNNISLLKIAQGFIIKGAIEHAEVLGEKIYKAGYKAILFAKIGYTLICTNEEEKGIEYFMKAINLLLNDNNILSIGSVLNCYLDAREYTKSRLIDF